jgi:hypothetical protein
MRRRFITSLAAVLLETGWVLAQAPATGTAPGQAPMDASASSRTLVPMAATTAAGTAPSSLPPVSSATLCGTGASCGDAPYCGAPTCGNSDPCYDDSRFWITGEFLLWHIKNTPVPELSVITTAPLFVPAAGGTTNFTFQNTTIFPEGQRLSEGDHPGWRLSAGFWADSEKDLGFDASYFQLERRTTASVAQQTTDLDVHTPFFALFTQPVPGGTPITTPIPSQLSGTMIINVRETGDSKIWGAEVNGRSRLWYFGNLSFDATLGARYIDLREDLAFTDNIAVLPNGPLTIGTTVVTIPTLAVSTLDTISTRNQFVGPQVGCSWDWHCDRVFTDGFFKVALGDMHQNVNVFGANLTPGGLGLGGALFSPGDLGEHTRDRYAFVIEVNPNIGYYFTSHIRGFVGYNFLWMQNVAQPGSQVGFSTTHTEVTFAGQTTTIDMKQPQFRFSESSVWVQGVNFGLEFRY